MQTGTHTQSERKRERKERGREKEKERLKRERDERKSSGKKRWKPMNMRSVWNHGWLKLWVTLSQPG